MISTLRISSRLSSSPFISSFPTSTRYPFLLKSKSPPPFFFSSRSCTSYTTSLFPSSPSSSSSPHSLFHSRVRLSAFFGILTGFAFYSLLSPSPSTVHSSSHLNVTSKAESYYTGTSPTGSLPDLRLFTGNANPSLAQEVADFLGIPLSQAKVDKFSDGECAIQILDNVRECHAFVVQPISAPTNDNLIELLLLVSTLRRSSAHEITVVIPYYGYCRQDRKFASRIPIASADVALMLEEMGVDRAISVDLHSGQIQGFFSPSCPCENLDSFSVGALYFSEKKLKDPVVVSPSAGGVYRAKKFREVLVENGFTDTDLALLIESRATDIAGRLEQREQEGRLDLVGNVKNCDCIIVEDIVDSGMTMQHAAKELKKQGARNVYGFASHGLFSGDAATRIEESALTELVTTNSVPINEAAKQCDKITQLTLAPLLAEAIRRVYTNTSISSLFDHKAPTEKMEIIKPRATGGATSS